MITLLLVAILLSVLFGTAWLYKLAGNIALFVGGFIVLVLLGAIGISGDMVFYGILGLAALGGALHFLIKPYENEHEALIAARKGMERAERYKREQEEVRKKREAAS